MTSKDETLVDGILNSIERISKILWVLDRRYIAADLLECLSESRTAKLECVEREIDIVNRSAVVEHAYWAHDLADVAHLATCRDDDATWAYHLLRSAVGLLVLLSHRQRILACRDVDVEVDGEIRASLNCCIKTSIFTCIAARPHPVGTERNALQAALERSKHDIGQCLGNGHH